MCGALKDAVSVSTQGAHTHKPWCAHSKPWVGSELMLQAFRCIRWHPQLVSSFFLSFSHSVNTPPPPIPQFLSLSRTCTLSPSLPPLPLVPHQNGEQMWCGTL